jgi:hypothetical protein
MPALQVQSPEFKPQYPQKKGDGKGKQVPLDFPWLARGSFGCRDSSGPENPMFSRAWDFLPLILHGSISEPINPSESIHEAHRQTT